MALETLLFKFLYPCGGYFWRIGRGTAAPRPDDPQPSAGIKALDPETGKTVWDFNYFKDRITTASWPRRGAWCLRHRVKAISSRWMPRRENSYGDIKPGNMMASPMSFAVDGRQYVAVASGDSIYCFALPE